MTQREKDDELHRARVHMQFVCRMYKLQHDEGRYFLHEHCQSELPWRKDCVEEIQEMTGAKLMSVRRGNCNLPSNEKPTVMVTSCPAIAFTLQVSAKVRLQNRGYSEHLGRNEHKSIKDLHEDISCGIRFKHKWSRQHKYLLATVDVKNPQVNFNDLENSVPPEESNDELLDQAWDDHTGESLDAKKVKEARQLEMEYYDKMHVFDKVLIAQCWERTGKAPLKARWVAKQFKGSDSEEWFAATPPIEALRALISHTTSGTKKKALMVCDVSRTLQCNTRYTWSCVRRRRRQSRTTNMCAKLRMSMYGTKAAAQNWQKKVQETMATLGSSIGKASPVLFYHPQRGLKCLVHGYDFVVSGCETSWSPSWRSTLQYWVTAQGWRRR